ncbi:MAG: hypothetical protein GX294_05585 [Candidatus Cloacimonetes bacterium]|nr:hypothetical protein [Candidatus Cloacimonadota bacterium]
MNLKNGDLMPEHSYNFHHFMPADVWRWKMIESEIDQVLALYDYEEIRLSILQDFKIINRGISAPKDKFQTGEAVDDTLTLCAVDNDQSTISLRPEGTISVLDYAAQYLAEDELHRLYYHGPMFRKDPQGKPQEFYQLGVELLGGSSILSESEVISLGIRLCKSLGLGEVTLKLNNFGCKGCRQEFIKEMRKFLAECESELCVDCFAKLSVNPLERRRCEDPKCLQILSQGPKITDYLCDSCNADFVKLKKIQANLGHSYRMDPFLYKNFSYYNGTVFDFVLGQGDNEIIIGGGGRYDELSEQITGKSMPAVGFYLDMDTIFDILKQRSVYEPQNGTFAVYLFAESSSMDMMLLQITHELHALGVRTVFGINGDELSQQMQRAKRKGCSLLFAIRDQNIRDGKILLYNLIKEHQEYIPLSDISNAVLVARKAINNE